MRLFEIGGNTYMQVASPSSRQRRFGVVFNREGSASFRHWRDLLPPAIRRRLQKPVVSGARTIAPHESLMFLAEQGSALQFIRVLQKVSNDMNSLQTMISNNILCLTNLSELRAQNPGRIIPKKNGAVSSAVHVVSHVSDKTQDKPATITVRLVADFAA